MGEWAKFGGKVYDDRLLLPLRFVDDSKKFTILYNKNIEYLRPQFPLHRLKFSKIDVASRSSISRFNLDSFAFHTMPEIYIEFTFVRCMYNYYTKSTQYTQTQPPAIKLVPTYTFWFIQKAEHLKRSTNFPHGGPHVAIISSFVCVPTLLFVLLTCYCVFFCSFDINGHEQCNISEGLVW